MGDQSHIFECPSEIDKKIDLVKYSPIEKIRREVRKIVSKPKSFDIGSPEQQANAEVLKEARIIAKCCDNIEHLKDEYFK